ncbi:hypothetical protein WJX74_003201 [Apatococcus lobatus]|uniref:Transposase n=1 Tax=Apatococcus lobatus TaxID=904363 RepID=A0AAW1QBU5_9CHLO
MPAAYSKDLCEKVIIKHFGLHQSITKVAEDLVVSEGFCRSVRTLWEQGRAFWKQGPDVVSGRDPGAAPAAHRQKLFSGNTLQGTAGGRVYQKKASQEGH